MGPKHPVVYTFLGSIGELVYGGFKPSKEHPGMPSMAPYMAAKAAVSMIARNLQAELGMRVAQGEDIGARVLLVQPQFVRTELGTGVLEAFGMPEAALVQLTPSGKAHEPHEIAEEILLRALNMYELPPGADMGDTLVPRAN